MSRLEELALEHVNELLDETANEIIALSNILYHKKEEFDDKKHIYPLHGKMMRTKRWIDAILENKK